MTIPTQMVFEQAKKIVRRYPDGTSTKSSSWGCRITIQGETRVLHVTGAENKDSFHTELSRVKRGVSGVRASRTLPTAWVLVNDPENEDSITYVRA